jgi:hypothetical protein
MVHGGEGFDNVGGGFALEGCGEDFDGRHCDRMKFGCFIGDRLLGSIHFFSKGQIFSHQKLEHRVKRLYYPESMHIVILHYSIVMRKSSRHRLLSHKSGRLIVIWRVLLLSGIHFALSFVAAFTARGWDLDHSPSRSALSEVAATLEDVLMFPHDVVMRAIPTSWLLSSKFFIPGAVFANSFFWGSVLYVLWRSLQNARGMTNLHMKRPRK